MLLLDSVYVNNGGGLILLKYLVGYLESNRIDVFYLFDKRTDFYFQNIPDSRKAYLSNSLMERHLFYKKNENKFNKVICFGNLPPTVKLRSKVFVYFHQKLFLEIPVGSSVLNKLILKVKQGILNTFKNNADFWLVQNEIIKKEFSKKYLNGDLDKVIIFPFYPELNFSSTSVRRLKNNFLYVSNSSSHKNHYNLIESFCLAFNELKEVSLTITVPSSDIKLCNFINNKVSLGYPIKNVGFIERQKLAELYLSHEYLIFPSVAESFGLGLAEAIDGGCKIIAADLNYTYEVCKPSLVFNPYSIESMKNAIVTAVQNELPYAQKLIENDISKIKQLLVD